MEGARLAMQVYAKLLVDNKMALINTVSGGPFTLKSDCQEITQFDSAFELLVEKLKPWMDMWSYREGGVLHLGKQFIMTEAGGYLGTIATYMAYAGLHRDVVIIYTAECMNCPKMIKFSNLEDQDMMMRTKNCSGCYY